MYYYDTLRAARKNPPYVNTSKFNQSYGIPLSELGLTTDRIQLATIITPPTMPVCANTSPVHVQAKSEPQRDMLVMSIVSSVADITLRAVVSRYKARAVETRPVHTRDFVINGFDIQETNWPASGRPEVENQKTREPTATATS